MRPAGACGRMLAYAAYGPQVHSLLCDPQAHVNVCWRMPRMTRRRQAMRPAGASLVGRVSAYLRTYETSALKKAVADASLVGRVSGYLRIYEAHAALKRQ
jgi:hypothetical protein